MALWTYHDWEEQATDALRLQRLRQHMTEVRGRISADVSKDGASRSSGNLTAYLQGLTAERDRLERATGARGGRVYLPRLSRPR